MPSVSSLGSNVVSDVVIHHPVDLAGIQTPDLLHAKTALHQSDHYL